jgi:formate-dependent nitrite reductase membrane component NrfD
VNHPLVAPPWGASIGVYIILTGAASGLTLAARWLRPAEDRAGARVEWIASWASLAMLAVCTMILIADLDQPARFYLMVTQFVNTASLMSWGAKIIALKIGLLAIHLVLLHRRRQALAVGDTTLTGRATRAVYTAVPDALALVSFALAVYPAFLLSWTWSSPAAHDAGSALVFLSSSVVMGAAGGNAIVAFAGPAGDRGAAARARVVLLRLVVAHAVVLGFVVLSLRVGAVAGVLVQLWAGAWAGAFWILIASTASAVVLAIPRLGDRHGLASSVAAVIAAATCRYLIFAVR